MWQQEEKILNLERGLGLFGLTQNKKVQIKFKASKQNN